MEKDKYLTPILFILALMIGAIIATTILSAEEKKVNPLADLLKEVCALNKRMAKLERRIDNGELRFIQISGDINETKHAIAEVNTRLTTFVSMFGRGKVDDGIEWAKTIDKKVWQIKRRLEYGNERFSDIEADIKALRSK